MLHHPQIRSADENWSGLKDAKARRKLQNRLNARAHRQRKLESSRRVRTATCSGLALATKQPCHYASLPETDTYTQVTQYHPPQTKLWNPIWKCHYVHRFLHPTNLPLSSDHLIPLMQFNLLRACLTNMSILDLTYTIPADCHEIWGRLPLFPTPTEFPVNLAKTKLQLATSHPSWINMLPDPVMRDNAVRHLGRLNQDDVLSDLSGGMCRGENDLHSTGILVWKDPWLPEGWEITQGFVEKYWYLVKGCTRMINAANGYRDARGEEPLVIELD